MKTRSITATALMAALVFAGTYFFKIPSPFGGYAHLGDCMIILGVCLLGTTRGMLAGAIGAGGLGAVALTYGYQNFNQKIMYSIVVVLIVLVAFIQYFGDWIYKKLK